MDYPTDFNKKRPGPWDDEPNVSDIRIDVTLLLNLLHDERAFKEEKFHQVPVVK